MRRLCLLAAAAFALGCGDGGSDLFEPTEQLDGTYNLSAVNGQTPPAVLISAPGYTLRVMSGNLVINTANTFSATHTFEENESGQITTTTETCTGTYTQMGNGSSIAFVEAVSGFTCGGNFTGTWDGSNRITVSYDASLQAVYTR
jgi:hypothetical protein